MSDHYYHEILDHCCDACKSCRDEYKEAYGYCKDCDEYLCKMCFDTHLMVRVARNHVLLESYEMPVERRQNHTSQSESDNEQPTECKTHPKNDIQLFCEYHDELCCSICTAVKHTDRLCKVKYIPEAAKKIIGNGQLRSMQSSLQDVITRSQDAEERVKLMEQENELQREQGVNSVKQFGEKIKTALKKREDDLNGLITSRFESNCHVISPARQAYHSVIADADKLASRLENCQRSDNTVQLFLSFYEAKMKISELESALAKFKINKKIDEYKVTCDPQLIKLIEGPTTVSYENVEKLQQKQLSRGKSKRRAFQPRMLSPERRNQESDTEYLRPYTPRRDRLSAVLREQQS